MYVFQVILDFQIGWVGAELVLFPNIFKIKNGS
jgi:hypothetical protein